MTTALFKFLFFLTIIITPIAYHSTVQSASADTTDLQTYGQNSPPFTPSPPSKSGIIFVYRGGFLQQPDNFYSRKVGDKLTFHIEVIRESSLLNYISKKKSTWWVSSDKKN